MTPNFWSNAIEIDYGVGIVLVLNNGNKHKERIVEAVIDLDKIVALKDDYKIKDY